MIARFLLLASFALLPMSAMAEAPAVPPESSSSVAATADSSNTPSEIDWVRFDLLLGVGLGGGSFSLFSLRWPDLYVTVVEVTSVAGVLPGQGFLVHTGIGPEVGYLYRTGSDAFSAGAQVGFGMDLPLGAADGPFLLGFEIAPTIRYRHYWGAFGLEAMLQWPFVFGSTTSRSGGSDTHPWVYHTTNFVTAWPLLGIGFGM